MADLLTEFLVLAVRLGVVGMLHAAGLSADLCQALLVDSECPRWGACDREGMARRLDGGRAAIRHTSRSKALALFLEPRAPPAEVEPSAFRFARCQSCQ